jgi:hypothetical protein
MPTHPAGRKQFFHTNQGADYTDNERDFLLAMDRFKREHQRPFPTWREVLAVVESLGWRRVVEANVER